MQQGVSGLGLEAQREAVRRYVAHHGTLLAEYVEVESGKRHNNRPQLQAALEHCKKARAILVIAKLDRLSRNVAFISKLLESDVQFVCCDNPHATKTMLHMLAVFAEHEREQISERTKTALARAKARGTRLGNPRYQESIARASSARWQGQTPPEVKQLIIDWRREGETLQKVADRLNGLNLRTPQGCKWYPSTIRAVLYRYHETTKAGEDGNTMGRNNESTLSSRLPVSLNAATSSFAASSAGRDAAQEGGDMAAIDEAQRMLDVFTSVGARTSLLTKLDLLQQKI
jgi:DNA invertase Pin-like site-specific DNA recombinase